MHRQPRRHQHPLLHLSRITIIIIGTTITIITIITIITTITWIKPHRLLHTSNLLFGNMVKAPRIVDSGR